MGYTNNNISFASPPPSASQSQFGFSRSNIELTKFVMKADTKSNPIGEVDGCFHTYTRLSREDSLHAPPVNLFSLASWRSCFPHVADIVDEEVASGSVTIGSNCTMLHVRASISTMTTNVPVQRLLCTSQAEVSVPGSEYEGCEWECVTRIYESGKKIWEVLHGCLHMTENDNHGMRRLTIPFEEDFWNNIFSRLSIAQSDGNGWSDHRRDEGTAIKGISVVQELFSSVHGLDDKQRSAVLMWEFSKADVGKQGKAVWRRVVQQPTNIMESLPAALGSAAAGGQFSGLLGIDTAVTSSMNAWARQDPRLPISPYEDPTADGIAYYSYPGPHSYSSPADPPNPGLDSELLQGSLPAITFDDINMGYCYPGQRGSSFEAYSMSIPTTTNQHPLEQYLRGNSGSGGNSSCGAAWPPHLSPISDRQSQSVVEDSDINAPY
jgi:transcriptional enhancer factor